MAGAEIGVVIDVDWLSSLRTRVEDARLRRRRRDEPRTIFRVPANMLEGHPSAYEPRIISFGPFTRDKPALKPMEKLKLRYVQRLLQRNPYLKLEDYVELIRGLEVRSRACYSEDILMGAHEFVEMMLLDACFIVEILLMQTDGDDTAKVADDEEEEEEEDPVLTTNWTLPLIEYDMLMLENQIPFLIVEEVFKLATSVGTYQTSNGSLNKLLLSFFDDLLPNEQMFLLPDAAVPIFHHILHFVHYCIMPEEYKKSTQSEIKQTYKPFIYLKLRTIKRLSSDLYVRLLSSFRGSRNSGVGPEEYSPAATLESVPCATMLKETGVRFKEKDARSFLDVAFRDGTMEIPTLQVYEQTNSLFRNLIAFEQCLPEVGAHVATYALFMHYLIDTAEDVALLQRYRCVVNGLGNDEDAAKLFNLLCKEVAVNSATCYLASVFRDVKKHCDSRWNKYRAKLMRDYFSNPWSFLSLVGALVIILLTFIQTSFAIITYVNPPRGF